MTTYTPMQLTVPYANDPLAVAQNTKAVLATQLFSSSTKIVASDNVNYPTLQISDSTQLVEANAIVRYLSGTKELSRDGQDIVNFEQTVLYECLKNSNKLDEQLCQKLSGLLKSGDINCANIIVFGALHGLVTFVGKSAISKDLQLVLWHQKFSGNPRVQPVVKSASQYNSADASSAPSSRATSQAKSGGESSKTTTAPAPASAPAAPAKEGPPKPERTGQVNVKKGIERDIPDGPILPQDDKRNIMISSALPYVNNTPHLGNIVGSTLSADLFARYCKARNYNCLYICGTDEYGTATETKAIEENMTPKDLCTKYYNIHKEVYDWFQIDFDYFGRTSTDEQTEIAQDIFTKLYNNGYLEEHTTEQLYCTEHSGFLADRFVEGICPYNDCKYEDARGDQCDKCGRLLNSLDLGEPRCKLDNFTPEKRETKHVYLSLDKLQDQIAEWNDKIQESGDWSKNGRAITANWLKEGLRPRAITRDLKWGTAVPLEGYEDKVLYVWFDACIGYISITANYTKDWEKWWKNPENVKYYQFMGKDNVPFHSVVFPGTELGTKEENWTMVHHINTTEYLQYEGGKFSKSRGIGVFGNNAQEIGVSASVWRYYLTMTRPESSDTQFSWSDFVARNNSELLANLGNFVNRIMKFVNAKYNGVIPSFDPNQLETFGQFKTDVNKLMKEYVDNMENVHLRSGLEIAMQISSRGNQFLQENKLDNNLLNNYPEKCAALVGVGLNLIYLLSAALYPFMPETGKQICQQLNAPDRVIPDEFDIALEGGHNINKAAYLFSRIDDKKVDEWKGKFGGKQE